jgi:hypothetical protein
LKTLAFTKRYSLFLAAVLLANSCIEPYDPPAQDNQNFLVVEGFLNTTEGNQNATIKISRSVTLASQAASPMETDAVVTLRTSSGSSIDLPEVEPGVYSTSTNFQPEYDYFVNIRTKSGGEYQSDVIALKQTPPIDSLTWAIDKKKLLIQVTTHDPGNNTWYYKWDFVQTHQYQSRFTSFYVKIGDFGYAPRPLDQYIDVCWSTSTSKEILLGTSENLTSDVIYKQTLQAINMGSMLISKRYSILVRQYALTPEAYTYWVNVERTSEMLGGLFDPLPSQVNGNVRCISNPEESVIGFISGGEIQEHRLYINNKDLPLHWQFANYPVDCELTEVLLENLDSITDVNGLVYGLYSTMGPPQLIGFTTSSQECIDCRTLGGTTDKPLFWE